MSLFLPLRGNSDKIPFYFSLSPLRERTITLETFTEKKLLTDVRTILVKLNEAKGATTNNIAKLVKIRSATKINFSYFGCTSIIFVDCNMVVFYNTKENELLKRPRIRKKGKPRMCTGDCF